MEYVYFSKNEEDTKNIGIKLAKFLFPNAVITLSGDLGAGKTTLTKGIAEGLKINDRVISPTFNILKCYFHGTLPLYHIDAYRLEDNKNDIGLIEFIDGDGVAVIEWPMFVKDLLPKEYLNISIYIVSLNERKLVFNGTGPYEKIIMRLKENE
jgi:tRNA threonylcarbamoyladenosine biosynthesis protein TsaE